MAIIWRPEREFFCLCLFSQHGFQGAGRLAVCLLEGMGIDVHSGGCLGMAQSAEDGTDILMACNQQGGGGVPLRYNYDKPEMPRISRVFGYQARIFILFQTEKPGREVVIP